MIKYAQTFGLAFMAKEEKNNRLKGEYKNIEGWFKRQLAISQARPKVEQAFFAVWAIFDVILLIVFGWATMTYLSNGSFVDARQSATVLYNVDATGAGASRSAPTPVGFGEAKSASVASGKYDLYSDISNFNDDWYATFDYVFEFGGGVSDIQPGFLNPSETRTLAAINVLANSRPTSLRLRLDNFVWHRVDQHQVKNIQTYLDERTNITLEEATYTKDITVGSDELARSLLTIKNRTAYAYWAPEFLVKLMRGSTVVSITTVTVPEFDAGETRQVEVHWFGAVPETANLSLEPMIPFFDQSVYMNPSSE